MQTLLSPLPCCIIYHLILLCFILLTALLQHVGANEEKVPARTWETGFATSVQELPQLHLSPATLLLLPWPGGCSERISDHSRLVNVTGRVSSCKVHEWLSNACLCSLSSFQHRAVPLTALAFREEVMWRVILLSYCKEVAWAALYSEFQSVFSLSLLYFCMPKFPKLA